MNKQTIPWFIIACLVLALVYCLVQGRQAKVVSELTPNWNFSSATGPNLYQQLANSFVFITKRTPGSASWSNGDYGDGEYALFVIQRGTGKSVCPAYSAVSIHSSAVNLDAFVGKAVLVTGFTQSNERPSAIDVERVEVDTAVNQKLNDYHQACPVPFRKLDESLGVAS